MKKSNKKSLEGVKEHNNSIDVTKKHLCSMLEAPSWVGGIVSPSLCFFGVPPSASGTNTICLNSRPPRRPTSKWRIVLISNFFGGMETLSWKCCAGIQIAILLGKMHWQLAFELENYANGGPGPGGYMVVEFLRSFITCTTHVADQPKVGVISWCS